MSYAFHFAVSMEMNRAIYIHEVLCSHILRFFCSSCITGSSGEKQSLAPSN